MIARILILVLSFTPAFASACSCIFSTNFCEGVNEASTVAGVKIVSSYYGIGSDHYIDVEVVDEILGEVPSLLLTFRTGHGTSCDPFPDEFIIGDTIIVNVAQVFNDPNWNGYSLSSPCSRLYIIPSDGGDGYGYQEFIDNMDDCIKEQYFFGPGLLDDQLKVFPNPASTELNIQNWITVDMKVKIFASNGAIVTKFDFDGDMEEPLDVSSWPRGLYIIQLESSDARIIRKFVKS